MNSHRTSEKNGLHRELRELTEKTLSPAGRYGHVALMLAAAGMGVVVLALLLTEPTLPFRTQAAFVTMLAIAVAWVGYSAWALLRRRPLMHAHRVVAGTMATVFSGLFTVVTLTAAAMTAAPAAWWAGGMGGVMLIAALALLIRAYRRYHALRARRDALQHALDTA